MRYDNYEKKIQMIAQKLRVVVKLLPLIIAVLAVITAGVVTLMAMKGNVGDIECAESFVYGDTVSPSANAFLSKVRYEYRASSGAMWSEEAPVMPGSYCVRAVGRTTFGNDRYSDEAAFKITKKAIEVKVTQSSVVYGEQPSVSAPLAAGDRIACNAFVLEDPLAINTNVAAKTAAVTIFDRDGKNVTSAYEISTPFSPITIEKRTIGVTVEDAQREYNGEYLSCDGYELSNGTLGTGDTLIAKFTESIVDVGRVVNTVELRVINSAGSDVTHYYTINETYGYLTVDKRPLIIGTGSLEAVYTGKDMTADSFEIDSSTTLVDGQTLKVIGTPIFRDAGRYENMLSFAVLDANGNDKTGNYSIIIKAGTVLISPASLSVTTDSNTWVYDGDSHYDNDYTSGSLIVGHTAKVLSNVRIVDAGTVKNKLVLAITDSAGKDVTKNYDIKYDYGTLEVAKRAATVTTRNVSYIYDGTEKMSTSTTKTGFVTGHSLSITKSASITDVGSVENRIEEYIVRETSSRKDVTANYEITFNWGTLTVTPRPITVKPVDMEKVYDGSPLTPNEVEVSQKSSNYSLVEGHTIVATVEGSLTDVGTSRSKIIPPVIIMSGQKDVTSNYRITTETGTITVLPRPVIIETATDEKVYDGTPLTNHEVSIADDSPYQLVAGHRISLTVTGSQTSVGESDNTCNLRTLRIYDQNSKDVTGNYKPEIVLGVLKVIAAPGGSGGGGGGGGGGAGPLGGGLTGAMKPGEEEPPITVATIKSSVTGTLYVREKSFGNYTGSGWTEAVEYGRVLPNGQSYNFLTSIAYYNTGISPATAHMIFKEEGIYFLPYYLANDGNYKKPTSDVSYTGKDAELDLSYFQAEFDGIGYGELIGKLGEYASYERTYRNFVHKNYLDVDSETLAYMKKLIAENGFSANDPDIVSKVAEFIKGSAEYNMYYDAAMDTESNMIVAFLDKYKEGVCRHYASAAVLLFRALGMPARYTVGYAAHTDEGQYSEITTPGHAWAEVYIDGLGWICVEVTGTGDPENMPGNLPGGGGAGGGAGGGGEMPKETITVRPAYCFKVYDGKPLYAENKIEANILLSRLLQQGFKYEVVVEGSRTAVGIGKSTIVSFKLYNADGVEVTDNYEIEYEEGMLEVLSPDQEIIRLYLYQIQKYYDGTALRFQLDDYEIIDGLTSGLNLSVTFKASLTDVGVLTLTDINSDVSKYITYKVTKSGRDVTLKYRIVFDVMPDTSDSYVPMRVDPRSIELTSASQSKLEDGKPLTNSAVSITKGSLASGHTLSANAIGEITSAGETTNDIDLSSVVITDRKGNDVTDNYNIIFHTGTLTVIDPYS